MAIKPYSKNQSIGIPENYMTNSDYKNAVKAKRKRNKYNAKSTIYNGFTYDSKLEAAYAQELDYRLTLGEIKAWQRQVRLSLDNEHGDHFAHYIIDFRVEHFDRPVEYVEVKGKATGEWRLKFKFLLMYRNNILEEGATITVQYINTVKHY